jgi:hypothetical protein
MRGITKPLICVLAAIWSTAGAVGPALALGDVRPAPALSAAQAEFFERDVRPVLVERCYSCHSAGAKKLKGGLLLDSRPAVLKGGDSGPSVVPGDPDKSPLVQAVRYADPLLQMPPDEKLPQREIDILVKWVKAGAPDPREAAPANDAPKPPAAAATDEAKRWWAFQPVRTCRRRRG